LIRATIRWFPVQAPLPGLEAWQRDLADGHLTVLRSTDDGVVHLSISHRRVDRSGDLVPGRYPTWNEIKEARYRFGPPDVAMVMVLPPKDQYVNVHETTFHLWQSREDWS
jgi:hypothetical protein